ncbi:RelA/SpoT domain-containing protein [Pantoea ananatis]|uniref:RelA/SpoT domain-containing protein n=1 Tax=Pantoea ananas TaxID=553 RepID=UPI002350FB34|nr:RelA/SpoT domain-containing protein [Pantoea ananatis]MDC7862919.1 hypothetical protein [Pantoea ananatis]
MSFVINEFMERYNKEFDFYTNLSIKTESELTSLLNEAGVRCIVSSRTKAPKRLLEKLESRKEEKKYDTIERVFEDIVDLSGVRIALYFPGDDKIVEDIIRNNFTVSESKEFPGDSKESNNNGYKKIFSGYKAKHYRAMLKGDSRYSNKHTVEIQVASVLMHAWSEVEHDLVYKPLQGTLSSEKLMILDEINGLVLAGNLALERLQQAGISRTSKDDYEFKNHFDVASFFSIELGSSAVGTINYHKIFNLLKVISKINRSSLLKITEWIKTNGEIFSNKLSNRFNNVAAGILEYRKLAYAICLIYRDDVLSILESKAFGSDGGENHLFPTEKTLTNSLKESLFIQPDFRAVSLLADRFETNLDLIGYSKDESLRLAMKELGIPEVKNTKDITKDLREYISLIANLSDDFTKENFEKAISLNKKILRLIKP